MCLKFAACSFGAVLGSDVMGQCNQKQFMALFCTVYCFMARIGHCFQLLMRTPPEMKDKEIMVLSVQCLSCSRTKDLTQTLFLSSSCPGHARTDVNGQGLSIRILTTEGTRHLTTAIIRTGGTQLHLDCCCTLSLLKPWPLLCFPTTVFSLLQQKMCKSRKDEAGSILCVLLYLKREQKLSEGSIRLSLSQHQVSHSPLQQSFSKSCEITRISSN